MVFEEILKSADLNNDKKISIAELVRFCAPDIDAEDMSDREVRIGKQNARFWLANVLEHDANYHETILQDGHLDVAELIRYDKHVTPAQIASVHQKYLAQADSLIASATI